jgi:AraC-like DNA-binding protein
MAADGHCSMPATSASCQGPLIAKGDHPGPLDPGLVAAGDELFSSWHRCLYRYRLDPGCLSAPREVSSCDLARSRIAFGNQIDSTYEEIERMHATMQPLGYATLLATGAGVILERQGRREIADKLDDQGLGTGKIWTEAAEGTNAIGTCLIEGIAVDVHRRQHFKRAHANITCAAAPLFDSGGVLFGALAVAAPFMALTRSSHVLASTIVATSARLLEERGFRKDNRQHWIFALEEQGWPAHSILLAVDSVGRVVGANRSARMRLLIDEIRMLAGISIHQLFSESSTSNATGSEIDHPLCLRRRGSGSIWNGMRTRPGPRNPDWIGSNPYTSHYRPRLALIGNIAKPPISPSVSRGLPPGKLKSTCAYIAENLAKSLSVESLAARVRLSRNYFLSAFKASLDVTPHRYISQQRMAKAAELLSRTNFSMADIALSVGFADQSHLTRSFVRCLGKTPSAYRREHR